MTDFDERNLENMLQEEVGLAPAPDLTRRIMERIANETGVPKGGDANEPDAILLPREVRPGAQGIHMTDENQPPQDPETLMDIEPTAGPVVPLQGTRRPSMPPRTPTQSVPRTPTQGAPRIPSSQVPAVRTTPGTMAEEPGQSPMTGGKIMVGTKLGQIEINGVLGKGGMGQVFRGYHAALDIEVAIKVLPDELSRNEVVRQRFLREARLCIKLDHPHIVRVFNVDEWQGNLYLVLELIEGTDAAGMLKDGGRFRYKRALEIGKAAAEALSYAHTQGLVHRDVKPHNILLGAADGKIKLSDFGLARAASSASHLTMSGQIMGTPHYMSPEQAESKEVTDKSDVYSLGVTLYHMLTGETPFVGDTPISVAVQHIAKEILYPEMRFAAFPKELVAVLKRMTAKDAAKRCSAKQAAVWLQKLFSMAGDDDLAAEPAAMRSLAPVVAESEAFRLAAERRKANDARAREEAKSMVMMARTMQEAMPAAAKTMAESGQPQPVQPAQSASQSQLQAAPAGGGMGKIIAVLLMLILVGGGAAGWYFGFGPGAKQNPANNATVIGGDGGKSDGGKTDGTKTDGGKTDGTKTDGAKTDGGTSDGGKSDGTKTDGGKTDGTTTDGGKTDGGKTDGTTTDGGKTDGAPTDGTKPPPEKDSALVAARLGEAEASINNAASTSDLKKAKAALEAASLAQGEASETQRMKLRELKDKFERQWAYYSVTEGLDTIEASLNALRTDPEADIQLNTAIEAKEAISKLTMPADVEALVKERRDELFGRVDLALNLRHDALLKKAEAAARDSKYEDAETYFSKLLALKLDDKRKNGATARRESVLWEGRISGTQSQINGKNYSEAKKRIADFKAQGVPDAQKDRFAALEKSLEAAVEGDFSSHVAAAKATADQGQYEAARNSLTDAGKLPLNDTQLVRLDETRIYVNLSEPLTAAATALNASQLPECADQLKAADGIVAGAGDKKIAEEQKTKLAELRSKLMTAVNTEFERLMKDAKDCVTRNEFDKAGASVEKAGTLPLSDEQRRTLDEFKTGNAQKLREYVKKMLDEVEDALKKDDFESAMKALNKVNSMQPIAEEHQTRFTALQQKVNEESASRFLAAYNAAISALNSGDFSTAEAQLAKMKSLPVGDALKPKVAEVEQKVEGARTDAVKALLKQCSELRVQGKYKEAKAKLDEAYAIATTEALQKRCESERVEWQAAVDDAFDDLLSKARKARENKDFAGAEKLLDQAKNLPLSQTQLLKLSDAVDDNKAKRDEYIKELFTLLENAVKLGDEKGGEEIVKKLSGFSLTVSDQLKLKDLKSRLSGETRESRIKRMPAQLQKLANDRFLQSEQMFKADESIEAVAASADGKVGAYGTRGGKVAFYNLRRGNLIGQSTGGRRIIKSIAVSPDGNWGACGNDDGNVVIFDLSGATVRALACAERLDDDITGLGFSTDSRTLFVLAQDGTLARFNVSSQTKAGAQPTGISKPNVMAVDPTGTFVAVGGNDGEIQVFDARSLVAKRPKPITLTNDGLVSAISFSQDGKYLAAASESDGVGMWETARLTDKPVVQYKGLDEWAKGVGFSADGRRVCGFDSEKRFVVWDRASGTENKRHEFEAFKTAKRFEPRCGFIGPDGTVLIGTADGEFIHFTVKSAN
ncbi:MAG: protein kinase [Planctomycetes bacterium]|nr:protein kinase [Planctomycetota bacterium]